MTNIFLRMPKFSLKYTKNVHSPTHGPKCADFLEQNVFSVAFVYKHGHFALFYLDNPFISNTHLVDSVKMAAEDDVRKKERDPILTVCLVVLVLAFAVVGGIQVNNSFFGGDSGPSATAGHTVEVDYNGSFYNFYDNDGIIFDTSLWSIANDEDRAKSFEFTLRAESSYTPLSFTVGDPKHGGLLPMFANAVTGMNKGDVARIVIDPANGYGALTEQMMEIVDTTDFVLSAVEDVPYDVFKTYYNDGKDIGGNVNGLTSPYGWKMNVKYAEGDKLVHVTHQPVQGETYDMNDDVKTEVYYFDNINIKYELVIDYETYTQNFEGEFKDAKFKVGNDEYEYVKAVKVFIEDREFFLYAVNDTTAPTDFVFKYIGTDAENKEIKETAGMFLCFVITVKSVS